MSDPNLRYERRHTGITSRQQRIRQKATRRLQPKQPAEPAPKWPLPPHNSYPQGKRECVRRLRQMQAGQLRP